MTTNKLLPQNHVRTYHTHTLSHILGECFHKSPPNRYDTFIDSPSIDTRVVRMDTLPNDLLDHILTFSFDTPYDVWKTGLGVNRTWASLLSSDTCPVWKTIANSKYGRSVTESSVTEYYNGNYKTLMQEDNCRGALPTIWFLKNHPPKDHASNQRTSTTTNNNHTHHRIDDPSACQYHGFFIPPTAA